MYKKNFIKEVILRADFDKPQKWEPDVLKAIKSKLTFEDVELKESQIKQLAIGVSKEDQVLNVSNIGYKGIYSFENNKSKFVLDPESFLLTTSEYKKFDLFFDNFQKGFNSLQQILKIKEFKRIGLRFVNIIKLDNVKKSSDWKKYINPNFIPKYDNINFEDANFSLRRNMNRFVFGDGEYFVQFNIGIWNKNFPSKITEQEFIIDIDCYIDNVILEVNDIINKPPLMSDITYNSFKLIIKSKFEEILEVE